MVQKKPSWFEQTVKKYGEKIKYVVTDDGIQEFTSFFMGFVPYAGDAIDIVDAAEIYEAKRNSSRGVQKKEVQIIVRHEGKQLIINKESGQIIDFYEGTSLEGFIRLERKQ